MKVNLRALWAVAVLILLGWIGYRVHLMSGGDPVRLPSFRTAPPEEPAPGGRGGLLDFYSEQLVKDAQRQAPPSPPASR